MQLIKHTDHILGTKGMFPIWYRANDKQKNRRRGFTLVELIISLGLFSLVMLLASGAYITMIGINRQVQGLASGINNLSFALETMSRNIRTGTQYKCPSGISKCTIDSSSIRDFSFRNEGGETVSYKLVGSAIQETVANVSSKLTGPAVTISKLTFYVTGAHPSSSGDDKQSRVTAVVSGTVSYGKGKTESFTIETGATMRGSDI